MKNILGPGHRAALAPYRERSTLIVFDYDGTLAPIVARPDDAGMRPDTRDLLGRMARRFPLVVLTGRSRPDVMRRLGGISVLEVIGNHGAELQGPSSTRFLLRVGAWRAELSERLESLAGVRIEDKRHSLAVHYRNSGDPEGALEQIGQAAAHLEGVRVVGGKKVVNLIPAEAPDKGAAFIAACARLGCQRAVYVGDDDTDEDVFRLKGPPQILAIRVGRGDRSAAPYYLENQEAVDALMRALLQ